MTVVKDYSSLLWTVKSHLTPFIILFCFKRLDKKGVKLNIWLYEGLTSKVKWFGQRSVINTSIHGSNRNSPKVSYQIYRTYMIPRLL